ncbi:hypothetical protein J1N35_005134 [Gossypium stocksii]|uniref:HAT C-terminal dimerisation domain-containing protein n=1 Tax=Gossypium stocksii TaxID=47602 RepID=A0A9D3WD85_9ROSI|nr:hypothetical protein J1N35_005134 [Gossypium stocksii]
MVKAGLELADNVVGKIRNGIKYIKKSGIRRKRFYDVADKSFHLNVTKKLCQDVYVRWNSTYLMLESSLYYKDVLDYWGQWDKDYQLFALSKEEWRNVAILCKFLKVFYDVTCVFSGSNYPTANLYFRGVWKVHKVLLDTVKASESAFSMGKKVITPFRSSLKLKMVQAVVCLDDWMRTKGFSTEIGCKNDDDDEDDEDDEDDVSSIAF